MTKGRKRGWRAPDAMRAEMDLPYHQEPLEDGTGTP